MSEVFSRTGRGLSNYHLFLNTEKVFFCEGEHVNTIHNDPCQTIDTALWKTIIEIKFGEKNYRIIPCGSKSQVLNNLSLAAAAEKRRCVPPRVFGCIDRDYGEFLSYEDFSNFADRLLVTEGYAVENDLLALSGLDLLSSFLLPRFSENEKKLAVYQLRILSRIFARIYKIDVNFRMRGINFISTDGLPIFIEKVKITDINKRFDVLNSYREFKAQKMRKAGIKNYRDLRKIRIRESLSVRDCSDGFLLCPGKMVLKSIAHLFNLLGKRLSGWNAVGLARLADLLLALVSQAPAEVRNKKTETPYSWAARERLA